MITNYFSFLEYIKEALSVEQSETAAKQFLIGIYKNKEVAKKKMSVANRELKKQNITDQQWKDITKEISDIKSQIDRSIQIIEKQKKDTVIARLEELKFPKLAKNIKNPDKTYSYLTELSLWTLTLEKIEELKRELKDIQKVLQDYLKKTVQQIWIEELDEFVEAYNKWIIEIEEELAKEEGLTTKKSKVVKKSKK